MKKYLVNFAYQLDEDKSFRYDQDCKKFNNHVNESGVFFYQSEEDNSILKDSIINLLNVFSKKFCSNTIAPESFLIKVYELKGINLEIGNCIIKKDYMPDDSVLIFEGKINDLDKYK